MFEAVGACAAGKLDEKDLCELERAACPGAGACGGQFTANTMALAMTLMGLSPFGANEVPATADEKRAVARRAGELVVGLVERQVGARTFITRASLANAVAAAASSGGSTNAVLHLLAIAREAEVPLTLDEIDAIAAATPVIADLKPGGAVHRGRPVAHGRRGAAGARAARGQARQRRADGVGLHARRGGRRTAARDAR